MFHATDDTEHLIIYILIVRKSARDSKHDYSNLAYSR